MGKGAENRSELPGRATHRMIAAHRTAEREPVNYPQLPHLIETEQALLGMMMVENAIIPAVSAVVQEADFYEPLHRRIYAAVLRIDAEKKPAFPLLIRGALGDDQGLAEAGGLDYLADLAAAAPAVLPNQLSHPLALARDISNTALRRRAMIAIWDAQEELAQAPRRSVTQILSPIVQAADDAAEREETERTGPATASAAALRVVGALRCRDHETGSEPIQTTIERLDEILGGFYAANLIIVAGRTGMGKSAFGTNLARASADQGCRVDYFSLEMTRAELVARLLTDLDYDRFNASIDKPISYSRMIKRRCSTAEIERVANMAELMGAFDLEIHDRGGVTIGEIAAIARAAKSRRSGKRGLTIIDHLHIIKPGDRYQNRYGEITEITHGAKALAKALNEPVVLLSQLSRDVEKRSEKDMRPRLSDLRDSGSIEEDADVVLLLHRPAYYVERKRPVLGPSDPEWHSWIAEMNPVRNRLDIEVAKNRHGATDTLSLWCDIGSAAIRDHDPRAPVRPDLTGLIL